MTEGARTSDVRHVSSREVRWFRDGAPKAEIRQWFDNIAGSATKEERTDVYDVGEARRGVGAKLRGQESTDTKRRMARQESVELAVGLSGNVEDWLKEIRPKAAGSAAEAQEPVEVEKTILRKVVIVDPDAGAGCVVELTTVVVAGSTATTVCFESFGPPHTVGRAFDSGISHFVRSSPATDSLGLNTSNSLSYPEWLARSHPTADGPLPKT